MLILLTNDDGIYAPGLTALHKRLAAEHELLVVAPETEQSAVGHSITLSDPIKVRPLGPDETMAGYAVSGTPADCIKLAVNVLMEQPPDLVLSGINLGANLGSNVLYSGTVSAASEAAIYGLPAMAFSLDAYESRDFTAAAALAAEVLALGPKLALEKGVCLNVNLPDLPRSEIKGFKITRQTPAPMKERFIKRVDPRGRVYYWQGGENIQTVNDPDLDHSALLAGYVSITPLGHRLTHQAAFDRLKNTI